MAEIIYRIPSKVPYGYVEVRDERPANQVTPEGLAKDYATFVLAYKEAESKALFETPSSAPPKSKPPIVRSVSEIMSDEDVDTEKQAKEILIKELGAVEVEDDGPWNNKPEPAKKEWEAPSDSSWDFS